MVGHRLTPTLRFSGSPSCLLDYERERKAAAAKLAMRTGMLDQAIKQKREELSTPEPEPAPDHTELKRSAAPIIESHNVLDLFAKELAKMIAGEETIGKLLFLVGTSRLLNRTMNAAVKGTSAGGKSKIRKRVLDFFPSECVVSFTALSEKALIYFQGDFAHKILSMGEATGADEQGLQDYLLRELMSEGRISYPTVQKIGNELNTITIVKSGPVSFLVTTTKSQLHPENETRMLSLEIDDLKQQTKNVMRKVAQVEGLNHSTTQVDYKPWQDFQRWLELGELRVVVPFASHLAELTPPESVRLRRDIGQVVRAIQVHALLHREHRARDTEGRIIANIEHDYETVRALLGPILAEHSGVAVKKTMLETMKAVEEATAGLSKEEGASAQDIARALKLDKSAGWRRLSAACDEGFVVNLEERKGRPGKYRRTAQGVEGTSILPTTEDVRTAYQTPQKTAQPCNGEENAESDQEDDDCNEACIPEDNRVSPIATECRLQPECERLSPSLATGKPLDSNGKSPPVAALQAFSGGQTCLHCGEAIGPGSREITVRPTSDGRLALVHQDCLDRWLHRDPPQ